MREFPCRISTIISGYSMSQAQRVARPPRLSSALIIYGILASPQLLSGATPAWWNARGATNGNPSNNSLVATQGQVKNFTVKAVAEINALVPGGAGGDLNSLVQGWIGQGVAASDKNAMTIGQLKWIASKIYFRLEQVRWCDNQPAWIATGAATNNQLASLGQLKTVFNFDLSAPAGQLPIWWQKYYFGTTGIDPNSDPNGDGISIISEYAAGKSPTNPDTDGDGIPNNIDPNPLTPEAVSSTTSMLVVWTELEN